MKFRSLLLSLILLSIPFCMHAAAVSPATIDVSGGRGEVVSSKFTIVNTQATNQTYYLDTLSFQAKDESGEPQFSSMKTTDSLAKWIIFASDHVTIPARSKIDAPFTIHIPADVVPGSYQSAITVSSAPAEVVATNGAIVEAKTAVLVFLTVNGDSTKKVELLDFKASGKGIQSDLHQTFTYRIQNQGNVYAIPEGVIAMKDILGRTIQVRDANESKNRVLPMSTRTFQVASLKPNGFVDTLKDQSRAFAIGPVNVALALNLGVGFQPIHITTSFWYIPYQLILSVLVLVVLLYLVYQFISKHKKT